MTRGAADPRQRFIRLAALVRQHEELLTRVVGEAEEALADFTDREPPPRELRGIGAAERGEDHGALRLGTSPDQRSGTAGSRSKTPWE